MVIESEKSRRAPERDAYSFDKLREYGVLWLINRVVFHPRGFALALEYEDGEAQPFGWSINGDGTEVWRFGDDTPTEDELFQKVELLLHEAFKHNGVPVQKEG